MNKLPERIRIKDIARLADVSVGTVDRVLHGRTGVSEASRKRVEEILKQLDYQPNMYASALASNKKYLFVCLLPQHKEGDYWTDVEMMAGGMLELIRFNGGVDYIIQKLTKHVNSKRGAELCIAALVSIANFCTANNTIAIITVGPLANDIATRYRVDKRKSASILDTFSCVIQGIIPYGAQMLIAAKLASLSPLSIIEYLYYPVAIGIFALLSIFLRYPRRYS